MKNLILENVRIMYKKYILQFMAGTKENIMVLIYVYKILGEVKR